MQREPQSEADEGRVREKQDDSSSPGRGRVNGDSE